jgi:SAM-dependent methyltransferase
MRYTLLDSWKNKDVFIKQLELNKKELSCYPQHWKDFIFILKQLGSRNILDIGCGVGAMSQVCTNDLPETTYTGIDYSSDAIDIAKKEWPKHKWGVLNYQELTKEFVKDFDTIYAGAILDVIPDGDDALHFILSLGVKNIIIGRAKLTEKPSYYTTYSAYDTIITYAYHHNIENLKSMSLKHEYILSFLGTKQQCNLIFQKVQ